MTRLHFQPIQGKSLDIIDAILQTEGMASLGGAWAKIIVVVEELVLNIIDYSNSNYLDVEVIRDEKHLTLRFYDAGVPRWKIVKLAGLESSWLPSIWIL